MESSHLASKRHGNRCDRCGVSEKHHDAGAVRLGPAAGRLSASSDDPNLVSSAGLVTVMALAAKTGLRAFVDEWMRMPGCFGANVGPKALALVTGMLTGADSIDDMSVLRCGAPRNLFKETCAPSTLGSFLRAFTSGYVRELDAAAFRWLRNRRTSPENLNRTSEATVPSERVNPHRYRVNLTTTMPSSGW